MDNTTRVAVIGLGKMGIFHSALLRMIPGARLVGVHDANQKLAKYVKNAGIDVPFYPSLDKLLSSSAPEAAFICTPPSSHRSIAQKCVDRGLDIFVEKPLAENLESARAMLAMVEGKDLLHATGFIVGHIPVFKKAKDLLSAGILGRVCRFTMTIYISQVFGKKSGWLFDRRISGGGVVIDIAAHLLYMIVWYFGLPARIFAQTQSFFTDVEDSATILMEYPDGMEGSLDVNWSLPGFRQAAMDITLEAENGTMEITNDYIKLFLHRNAGEIPSGWSTLHKIDLGSTSQFDLGSDGFYDEDRHFIESCLNRTPPDITWKEGLAVQTMVESIYLSAGSRLPVELHSLS